MIDQALVFLKEQLNQRLRSDSGLVVGEAGSERDAVVFVDGEKMEPLSFPSGTVSILLINIEQDRTMRRAEPHRGAAPDGTPVRVSPELRLELSVLFVARFKQYEVSLKVLSAIVRFFQERPLFQRTEQPELPDEIERIVVEPVSLPFAEQNEVWNALRTTYHPSVLYRVRTLVFRDRLPVAAPAVAETDLTVGHKRPG